MTSSEERRDISADTRLQTIDTHTAGEPTRILLDGVDHAGLSGESVTAKRDSFADTYDWVRELLMCEPRGHKNMFGAVPVESGDPTADLGVFFMDREGFLDMCGHGTIGVVTALAELGELTATSTVRVETPAGVVEARPEYTTDGVAGVTVRNVESFVYETTTVPVPFREVPLEVAVVYAGNFFALVDSNQLSTTVDTTHTDELIEWGLEIRDAVNDELDVVHPFSSAPDEVAITEIYESGTDPHRSIVVFGDGQVDRSPCGTGTCAKMALLHETGKLDVGAPYTHESIAGTRFEGRILDANSRAGFTVVTPEITGSAHITGRHTFVQEATDPITGLRISSENAT